MPKKLALSDFAAALQDDAVASAPVMEGGSLFSAPIQRVIDRELKAPKADAQEGGKSKKQTTASLQDGTLEAPLAKRLRKRISRRVAFEESSREVSKWAPLIRSNRSKDTLVFPLNSGSAHAVNAMQAARGVSVETLLARYDSLVAAQGTAKDSAFEQTVLAFLCAKSSNNAHNDTNAITDNGTNNTSTHSTSYDQIPACVFTEKEATERHAHLSRMRSMLFFQEARAKRQAKIKSKSYRKMLKKERLRREEAAAAADLDSALDPESIARGKLKAQVERARERLTLKTRRVSLWASDALKHRPRQAGGEGAVVSRAVVMAQVRDKEILRKKLLNPVDEASDDPADESDDDDDLWSERAIHRRNDKRHFAGDGDGEAESEDARQSTGQSEDESPSEGFAQSDENEILMGHDSDSPQDDVEEPKVRGRRSFVGSERHSEGDSEAHSDPTQASAEDQIIVDEEQEQLMRMAFADDDLFEKEFEGEKARIVEEEAPQERDITLPGWGTWSGAGIDPQQQPRKIRVIEKTLGVDASKRADRHYRHVIINERAPKAYNALYGPPKKAPFPFRSIEDYQRATALPIGPELNPMSTFKKQICPSIIKPVGAVIEPLKYVKQQQQKQPST